ncbi:MAG: hypothetical protein U9N81_04345 [Bacillota bacterium]|nr:hypothetical protein [Bacillota bacterium]
MSNSDISLVIDQELPILHDFKQFMVYLQEHFVPLIATRFLLNKKDLYSLNQLMEMGIEEDNPNLDQESYPLLHLFYHIGLEADLLTTGVNPKASKKAGLLVIGKYQLYLQMSPYEQYISLLEALWCRCSWKELQPTDNRKTAASISGILRDMTQQKPGQRVTLSKLNSPLASARHDLGYFWLYFEYFAWWKLERDEDAFKRFKLRRDYIARAITPTELGVAVARVLSEQRKFGYWNIKQEPGCCERIIEPEYSAKLMDLINHKQSSQNIFESMLDIAFVDTAKQAKTVKDEAFFMAFVPLFPAGKLQNSLPYSEEAKQQQACTYSFKVSLGKKLVRWIDLSAFIGLI